ncbi:type VI secretion system Vgr family protein [Rugamonas apoptosis]|uniref:Type VI secretion system tip protein VgrG n=1 Tax=Rugamonas apoptosis TaxID=2758570 RepID=A0A7W2FBR5_9BURK|nr:type VI secretion system Vgr family protein [Rugamonas apoptosis]MBA5688715.1 type VI secretion system tip protein VgrG [Rugamonas apoptosis]
MDDNYFDDEEQLQHLLTASNRPLRLRLGHPEGVSDELLLPQRIEGVEAICDGIELRIYCVALQADLPLKTLIGLPAEIQIVTDQGDLRSLCGIVTEASQGESDGGLASYQLVLRDALAILDLNVDTRVFFKQSELDVVQAVLRAARRNIPALAATFDFEIDAALGQRQDPVRRQIIQCNEGTGAFVRRLLKRRGISWFFRAGSPKAAGAQDARDASATPAHTMVLFHDGRRLKQSPAGTVRFHRDSATEERDTIAAWSGVRTLRPGRATHFSWDYGNPRGTSFMTSSATSEANQGATGNKLAAGLERYLVEAPHVRDNFDDLSTLTQQSMARSDFEAKCYYAEGGVRDCGAGEYIGLEGHPDLEQHPAEERNFIIVSRHIMAQNNLPKGYDARIERLFARNRWHVDGADLAPAGRNWFDSGEMRFLTRLTCVRRDVCFMPAYDPRIDLPHPHMLSAIVAGPEGEEVHCDAQGRVKVRLGGMREQDDSDGDAGAGGAGRYAWVRVASNWAGTATGSGVHFGALLLPRPGTEVLIAFLGGDPDKPIIIGQLYNNVARPPYLGAGDLPGNRYLSGLKSREIRGKRANQLRLDDTTGQISAQLASDHGRSELNLGWLSEPRNQGAGKARGEGAELSTDAQLALRAGKGMLLSAWRRLSGGGKQLDRADYLTLMQDCVDLFRSLGQYAAEHQGLSLDDKPQGELQSALKQWEQGSNTAPQGAGGGAAAIGMTAPDGISFATSKAIVSYAATNIDTVAQQNLQFTSGQHCNVNAGKGLSLFAQQEGLVAIANYGKVLMQSQHDSTQIDATKDVKVAARGRVTIMAEEIVLVAAGGAYLSLKGGTPEIGGPGAITIKTAGHHWNGPASQSAELPTFGEGDFRREPHLARASDGQPVKDMALHLVRDGDCPLSGTSDAAGTACKVDTNRVQELGAFFHKPRT